MVLLDENVLESQRLLLVSAGFSVRQIGVDVGHKGLQDEEIIVLLRRLRNPTLITRDVDFYARPLRHRDYCLAVAQVSQNEVATFARRFLRCPEFDTQVKRAGTVARISQTGVVCWRWRKQAEEFFRWSRYGRGPG